MGMGAAGIFGGLLENVINARLVERGNNLQTGRVREANDLLTNTDDVINQMFAPYQDKNYLRDAAGIPGATLGGRTTGNADNAIDTGAYFANGQRASDPTFDWDQLNSTIKNGLARDRVSSGAFADQIGSYFDTSNRFGGYVSDENQKTAASSRARESQARSSLLSRAAASGKSLDEVQGQLDSIGLQESQARAMQTATTAAEAEKLRSDWMMNRSKAMSEAAIGQQQNLTQSGIAEAGLMRDTGIKQADLAQQAKEFDITSDDQRKKEAWDAFTEMMDKNIGAAQFAPAIMQALAQYKMGIAGQQSSNLTGQSFAVPQFDFLSKQLDRQAMIDAAKQQQKKQPSFGIQLGPVGFGI